MSHAPPYSQPGVIRLGPRLTPAVRALIIANVGVFVLQQILFVSSRQGLDTFWLVFGLSPDLVIGRLWLWQPLTYMFLHGGVGHLVLNLLMVWMFGCELEAWWGSRRFLVYYLICGVGAAATTAVFDFHSRSIGASGAVFGLLLAFGMLFPRRVILLWFILPVQARHLVWICAGIEFLSLINIQAARDGIAHWAHLGGMLFGWVYLRRGFRLRGWIARLRWRIRRSRFRVIHPPDDGPGTTIH